MVKCNGTCVSITVAVVAALLIILAAQAPPQTPAPTPAPTPKPTPAAVPVFIEFLQFRRSGTEAREIFASEVKKRIIGQEDALIRTMQLFSVIYDPQRKDIVVVRFIGPTGTGKT
jgi:hypothetical protein